MSDSRPTKPAGRSRRALASVAVLAVIVSGALGTTYFEAHTPALALDAPATTALLSQPIVHASLPTTFADVVDRTKPAVVAIQVKIANAAVADNNLPKNDLERLPPQLRELFRRFDDKSAQRTPDPYRQALGSGFFISPGGYVVTNNHVVEHAELVQVTTDDGSIFDARVVGTDPKTDIALLKVSQPGSFPYVRFAKTMPRVGDWVVAIGNPFGLGGTVTAGIVSARGRDIGESQYDDFLQIDAPINKGNSGGPTFDLDGAVVGMNTAIYSPSGGSIGLGFAIPSGTIQSIVTQLEKDGKVTRGYLGVQIQPLTKDLTESMGMSGEKGALVNNVQDGTPAAMAGLKAGDVITAINGEEIANVGDLSREIAAFPPRSKVQLTYWRTGKVQTVNIDLSTLPTENRAEAESQDDRGSMLGLELAPARSVPGAGNKGVAVLGVDPSGPAAARGLKTGDVILEADGQAVMAPGDVKTALGAARHEGKQTVLLRVKNRAGTRFVAVAMTKAG